MKFQRGFTLIELVVVIVILGIMAAIAVPKFVDITVDAHSAAGRGVAGALASSSSINFASRTAGGTTKGVAVSSATSCTAAVGQTLLAGNGVTLTNAAAATDSEFQITAVAGGDCSAGAVSVQCNITPKGTGAAVTQTTLLCIP